MNDQFNQSPGQDMEARHGRKATIADLITLLSNLRH